MSKDFDTTLSDALDLAARAARHHEREPEYRSDDGPDRQHEREYDRDQHTVS